jgi:hypothetical protein
MITPKVGFNFRIVGGKDTNKRNSWRKYVIPTIIEIGIVVIILFIAAIVELQMIRTLGV